MVVDTKHKYLPRHIYRHIQVRHNAQMENVTHIGSARVLTLASHPSPRVGLFTQMVNDTGQNGHNNGLSIFRFFHLYYDH